MSEEKILKARVKNKRKTEREWRLDVYDIEGNLREDAFKPLKGELIIFAADYSEENPTGCKYDRFKFGDDVTNVIDLPFADEEIVKKLDNLVPLMSVIDEEDGHYRMYYIKSGTPVETTELSVEIPEGKSIMVRAFNDTTKGDYSYLNADGSPMAPPIPIGWPGALPTPIVTVNGTTASWNAIEGATGYHYIIGDVTIYHKWGTNFANTYSRVYVELPNGRGTYGRYVLTSDEPPRDPDPGDYAQGKYLGSIPMRQDNGYILAPAVDASEASLAKLAAKGYNLDLYLMPKKYTDDFTKKYTESYFTNNAIIIKGEGENSLVQKGGTEPSKVTGKLATSLGQNNTVSGFRGFAAGVGNTVTETCAAAFGEGNINNSWLGFTAGQGLKALYHKQYWLGTYNKPVEKDVMGYPLVFGVGSGSTDGSRKNAIEVYSDGRLSLGRLDPKLDNDATTKKYVDEKIASVITEEEKTAWNNGIVTDKERTTWNAKSNFSGKYEDLSGKPTIPTSLGSLRSDANYRTVTDTEKTTWNNKLSQVFPGTPQHMGGKTFTPGWWTGYILVKNDYDNYVNKYYSLGTFYIPISNISNFDACEVSVWNDKFKRRIEIDCNTGQWVPYDENGTSGVTTVLYAAKIQ
jgi:hypothetical protein